MPYTVMSQSPQDMSLYFMAKSLCSNPGGDCLMHSAGAVHLSLDVSSQQSTGFPLSGSTKTAVHGPMT